MKTPFVTWVQDSVKGEAMVQMRSQVSSVHLTRYHRSMMRVKRAVRSERVTTWHRWLGGNTVPLGRSQCALPLVRNWFTWRYVFCVKESSHGLRDMKKINKIQSAFCIVYHWHVGSDKMPVPSNRGTMRHSYLPVDAVEEILWIKRCWSRWGFSVHCCPHTCLGYAEIFLPLYAWSAGQKWSLLRMCGGRALTPSCPRTGLSQPP